MTATRSPSTAAPAPSAPAVGPERPPLPDIRPLHSIPNVEFEQLPVSQLVDSPTNPRAKSGFTGASFDELVESVAHHGVVQPILVRPRDKVLPSYEIVFGHRRVAAARKAKRPTVPAMVAPLDDLTALELQVLENLQRADLHPLEEADGFARLMSKHRYDVQSLADRCGKSKAYIYGRLKLRDLGEMGRQAFLNGKLEASVALLVSRVPGPLQPALVKQILTGGEWNDEGPGRKPMRYREAFSLIRDDYMLELGGAPFDKKDATLVPAAGSCSACPKRTGNAPDLFGDVKSTDVCTDPRCFRSKLDADWARKSKALAAEGRRVLGEKEAAKVFQHGGHVASSSGFVPLDEVYWELPSMSSEKKLGKVIGKALAPEDIVVGRDLSGRPRELVVKKDLPALLKRAGVKVRPPSTSMSSHERRRKLEGMKRRAGGHAQVEALLEAIARKPDIDLVLELVLAAVVQASWHDVVADVVKRRKLEVGKGVRGETALVKHVATWKGSARRGQLMGLIAELCASRGLYHSWGDSGKLINVAGKLWRVNMKAAAARGLARLRAKAKVRAAKKAGQGKAAGRRARKGARG